MAIQTLLEFFQLMSFIYCPVKIKIMKTIKTYLLYSQFIFSIKTFKDDFCIYW